MKIQNHTLIEIEKSDIINGSCTIPEGITSIGNFAFYGCETLKSITLPDSLTSIGYCAFYGCKNLENITLPDSITSIGNCSFDYCENLKNIILPDGLTSIGSHAFEWCQSLESITLPDSITSIGNCSFYGCKSLKNITLSEKITRIGYAAFNLCESLTQIQWGEGTYQVTYVDGLCMYILQTKELGAYMIYKCRYFPEMQEIVWIAEKDGLTAHGASVKAAIRDVDIKLLEDRDITEHITRIKSQGYVTPLDYRLITGACETGTAKFLKRNHLTWNDKRTVAETIKLTAGEYGHETFVKALKEHGCIS